MMKSGNNMPVQAPLVPDPILPYSCKNSRTVYAICEVKEETLRRHLSPTPFEYVNNLCMIYVNDFSESSELPYMDAGIIFTVKYKDTFGGYYMYEWEDDDAAIETGRYWGYPKKFGQMTLERSENIIRGTATRRGVKLIDIELDCADPITDVPQLHTIYPHLNLLTIPNPDGPGIFSQRVTARDNSSTCKTLSNIQASVKVTVNSSPTDPIGDFAPLKVLGGGYSVTDFLASTENGWAKVIDTII
ncbi:acetoacetate decarboxylase family protein [Ochrobactrum sp. CM-21-5]|nr:acetoacetate decarboxylase family protein [Ochrobactrum sp. CM-21-5]MBC2885446.1 acetoacetate decarboxylase family protein [Ochrobactrum sp. CM-21-5]